MNNDNIQKLLNKISLKEKLSQMLMIYDTDKFVECGKFSEKKAEEILGDTGIGCIYIPISSNLSKRQLSEFVFDFQNYLITKTQYGIPAIVVAESLHGVMFEDMTVFPQIIGLSCSWNEVLIEKIAECISLEAESVGITQVLAPDLDIAREPRWGRVEETFGEDPYLTSKLGARYTRGIRKSKKVAATLKHFVAHGEPENGINLSPISIGERKLRELYLPVFEASIQEDPLSIMPAYHDMDGKPCHTSYKLLTEILRDELKFDGYTISDFEAISMLCGFQRTAVDASDAGKQALEAGVDLEAPNEFGFGKSLLPLLEDGTISEELIDKALCRIFSVKERLGLFDLNYQPTYFELERTDHKKLALEAAEESIVLLKNDGVLPIKNNIKQIAVIGPNSNVTRYGDYSSKTKGITLVEGLKNQFDGIVTHTEGSTIFHAIKGGVDKSVALAKEADLVILALGGSDMMIGGVGWGDDSIDNEFACGEGFDSYDLRLPPAQVELAEQVLALGKPVVLLLQDGRPCAIPEIYDKCDAIIQAWYAGEQGGTAMTNILLGKVNPSGKLTMTIPKHVGQVPLFYNHKPSARGSFYQSFGSIEKPGRSYTTLDPNPYFKFGFGLSYTQFKYDNLNIVVDENGKVTVTVDVKNIGDILGKEIVQLYVNDVISSTTTPIKALKGFKKITIAPGETKLVEFTLGFDELYLIDDNMKKTVEPGWFEVYIADQKGKFFISKEQCELI